MIGFNLKRTKAIARKEIFHILRDPFTLAMAVVLPVVMVTIFGLAIDFDVKDLRLSVFDSDGSQASRQLVDTFKSSRYFRVEQKPHLPGLLSDLDSERTNAVLVIEPEFERNFESGGTTHAQVILDGSDSSTVGIILGYLRGIQSSANAKINAVKPHDPVALKTRFLYNPELKSSWFVVPGLAVVIIAILSVLLTALTVAREWENGSMELLLSTPVQPIEIIIGKLAPYTALGITALAFVYLVARLGFGVPFRGSHLLFGAAGMLFQATYLAQGLAISVITRRQQLAMQFAIITGLLPSILLSGFIFPIESMPTFFQFMTSILPAKWFMMISRGIFLKGAGISELIRPFAGLLVLSTILITVAAKRFKKDLEP